MSLMFVFEKLEKKYLNSEFDEELINLVEITDVILEILKTKGDEKYGQKIQRKQKEKISERQKGS